MTKNSHANKKLFHVRIAFADDIPTIQNLQQRSIAELQRGYLSEAQIKASFAGMGLDTQLIDDGTYLCVNHIESGALAGCGGWSRRATLYGGNHSEGRNARLLDPATEPARIRAMYTHPDFTRMGVGRLILDKAEAAARAQGFKQLTMAATAAGRPFYLKCGYTIEDTFEDTNGGVAVPLYTMTKRLDAD